MKTLLKNKELEHIVYLDVLNERHAELPMEGLAGSGHLRGGMIHKRQ
jgi:hypothetical protein